MHLCLCKTLSQDNIWHCYHINDFPLVNSTPGIIQDPIDLLLAKSNFTNKRWMVLVFSTCNTILLLLVKLHFVNKRRIVLAFSTFNTVDLLLVKLHLLYLIFYEFCDHVNDFPVVNGTPGFIQDPVDLLLTKYNIIIKGHEYCILVLAILMTFCQ